MKVYIPQNFFVVNFFIRFKVYNMNFMITFLHERYFDSYNYANSIFCESSDQINMRISSNIRTLRKKAGLTQIDLAEKIGVSIATLRRWESGETTPNGSRIIELANLLNVSPDEIVAERETINGSGRAAVTYPHDERANGMLIFEGEGTRIELPPTEKGYELFDRLVENLINRKKISTANLPQLNR